MRSLVKAKPEPGIWMQDVATPVYGVNDVLIKIHKTAICGTDIHIFQWDDWASTTIPVPMTVGHEFYGEVVAMGDEVAGLEIGQRVSGEGHITCGHCRNCRAGKRHLCRNTQGIGVNRPGCFADYLSIPAINVISIPDNISGNETAVLDPLGNAVHCALTFPLVGEDVLITGAGPIGIMAVAIARHAGARHIIISDVNDYRLGLARQMGATRIVNVTSDRLSDAMHQLGMIEGFDVGLEMSGSPQALCDMVALMNHGGSIALLGIPPEKTTLDWNHVIFKCLQIKGIYGREMFETWYKMIAMLQSGLNIDPVITHEFHVDDYETAFQMMASGQTGKVILNWV